MKNKQLKVWKKEIKLMGLNDLELFKSKISMSGLDGEDRKALYKSIDKRQGFLTAFGGAMVEMGDYVPENGNDRIEA